MAQMDLPQRMADLEPKDAWQTKRDKRRELDPGVPAAANP